MRLTRSSALAAVFLLATLAGCSATATEAPSAPASSSSAASAEPTETGPDPEAIRDVDFGAMTWTWDSLGVQYPVTLVDSAATAVDEYYGTDATFSLGTAVYSDANGDGLTDAALPLTWELGNGIAENWFIWLAQEDGSEPQQIPFPIASSARCGNGSATLAAVDGGFRVDEVVRSSLEMADACAVGASYERSRDVVVVGDGTGAGSWPATADGAGWGGFCPVKQITEGAYADAAGRVGPSADAPETTVTGEQLYTLLNDYPFLQPEGWALTGWIVSKESDSVVCVWVPTEA